MRTLTNITAHIIGVIGVFLLFMATGLIDAADDLFEKINQKEEI